MLDIFVLPPPPIDCNCKVVNCLNLLNSDVSFSKLVSPDSISSLIDCAWSVNRFIISSLFEISKLLPSTILSCCKLLIGVVLLLITCLTLFIKSSDTRPVVDFVSINLLKSFSVILVLLISSF